MYVECINKELLGSINDTLIESCTVDPLHGVYRCHMQWTINARIISCIQITIDAKCATFYSIKYVDLMMM